MSHFIYCYLSFSPKCGQLKMQVLWFVILSLGQQFSTFWRTVVCLSSRSGNLQLLKYFRTSQTTQCQHPRRLASGALRCENRCCIWLGAVSKLWHHISQETFCSLCWDCLTLLSFQQACTLKAHGTWLIKHGACLSKFTFINTFCDM